jgi:hypothetical protein
MPVNQNLVTIQANPQLGVRGTLAPPCDMRPRAIPGQTFWDHSNSQRGRYSISDSAGHSHSGRLGGKETKTERTFQLGNDSTPFPGQSIRRDRDNKRPHGRVCHSEVKNLLHPRVLIGVIERLALPR